MKKMKKFLSAIMALIMVITIIPLSAITSSAAPSGTCGDNLTWTFDEGTSTLTISGAGEMNDYYYYENSRPWDIYSQDIKNVVIGDNVTTIGDYAFCYYKALTSITISDSVKTIGDYAFCYCRNLTSITIPDSVTVIGCEAFSSCAGITSVTIGDSVTTIGDFAFSYCNSLAGFTVNSNNQYYSNDEFGVLFNKDKTTLIQYPMGNTRTSYTIPESVVTIGDWAFFICHKLTNVTIPYGVKTIGDFAFNSCINLTGITIPDSVTTIGDSAFYSCENLTDVIIGNHVTEIGDSAFCLCSKLTSITIPDSVTTIGDDVFAWCKGLTSFAVDSNNQYYSNDEYGVLFNKDKTTLIKYPVANTKTSYTIPDSVVTIEKDAFHNCESLSSITIGNSVKTIDDFAFARCNNLISVSIPDSVTKIGENAFFLCENLTSITIPDGITEIDFATFDGCDNLKYVYYAGTEDDWNSIVISDFNEPLNYASIHFNVQNESDMFTFEIPEPSNTCLRNRDGIILHTAVDGNVPEGWYVIWTSDNNNFKEKTKENDLQVVAKNNGYTTFTTKLCDADGNVLAIDNVELYSKSSFSDKIGGLFRLIFGLTEIYEY